MFFCLRSQVTCTLLLLASLPDGQHAHRRVHEVKSGRNHAEKWFRSSKDHDLKTQKAEHSMKVPVAERSKSGGGDSLNFVDLKGTASFITLIEELLTKTKLTVPIYFNRQGMIRSATFSDVYLVNTTIGRDSGIEVVSGSQAVKFMLKDVVLFVRASLDMKLVAGIPMVGTCEAKLFGGEIALTMPMKRFPGPGGCGFDKKFDIELLHLDSDSTFMETVAPSAVGHNAGLIRRSLVQGMEKGVCHALLGARNPTTAKKEAALQRESLDFSSSDAVIGLLMLFGATLLMSCCCCGFFACGWYSAKRHLQEGSLRTRMGTTATTATTATRGVVESPANQASRGV